MGTEKTMMTNALSTWMPSINFIGGGQINSLIATAGAGIFNAPGFLSYITGKLGHTALEAAVASAVDVWRGSCSVPGLPWYPTFAAVPAPIAPPTPNTPTTLAQHGGNFSGLSVSALMNTGASQAACQDVYDAFIEWISSKRVSGVIGSGPVPTFRPPFFPVGAVVGGTMQPKTNCVL